MPTPTPTPQQAAQQLAAGIAGASSDAARSIAVQRAFEAAGIGVYDASTGKAVRTGMETGPHDFVLLTGEADLLSEGYAARDTFGPQDLAILLTAANIQPGAKGVDPQGVAALIRGVTKWATDNPTEHAALVPLLVRDLGQSDTPTTDTLVDPSHLDAVQFELLAVYFLGPIVHAAAAQHATFRPLDGGLDGLCTGVRVALNPFNPNTYLYIIDPNGPQFHVILDDIGGIVGGQIGAAIAQMLGTAIEDVGKTADAVTNIGYITKLLHMLYLNRAMTIETTPDASASHFGPANSGDPDISAGQPMRIQATLRMTRHVDPTLQKCLGEAGFTIPDYGPVPHVSIDWRNVANNLENFGTISYDPANGYTGDGSNGTEKGVSTLVFTPNNEKYPGFGTLYKEVGSVQPFAVYGLDFGNEPAAIAEGLDAIFGHLGFEPTLGGSHAAWTVGYHKPRGFKFTISAAADETPVGGTVGVGGGCSGSDCVGQYLTMHEEETFTAHICGDNPYGIWTVNSHYSSTATYTAHAPGTSTQDETQHWALDPNNEFTGGYSMKFVPGAPLQVTWTGSYGGGYWTTVPIHATATVQNDDSCPDNG